MGGAAIRPIHGDGYKVKDAHSLDQVEKFTHMAYDMSPKNETIKFVLTCAPARAAFIKLFTEEKNKGSGKYLMTDYKKVNLQIPVTTRAAQVAITQYELPHQEIEGESTIADDLEALLDGSREYPNEEILGMLNNSQNEMLIIYILNMLPKFFISEHFKEWRDVEKKAAFIKIKSASRVNITIPEILVADPAMATAIHPTSAIMQTDFVRADVVVSNNRNNEQDNNIRNSRIIEAITCSDVEDNTTEKAFKHVDYLEIDRILRSGSWLFTFIAAIENIPVCITLSTARMDRAGFPLIYVNRQFEVISGYNRSDIMGANCKFLQRDRLGMVRSEADSVERLSAALRKSEPAKVAITNFKRDGTPFRNLLALKPVFDLHNNYEYVIGVQFDISSQRSSSYALRLVDSLIKVLPGIVVN